MIVGELVFCIAIGIFTVFIVSIISILLVIAELVLMMFQIKKRRINEAYTLVEAGGHVYFY